AAPLRAARYETVRIHSAPRADGAGATGARVRVVGRAAQIDPSPAVAALDLAPGYSGTGGVRVPARDARVVFARREGARRRHGEDRRHPGREWHDLPVGRDPRELEARAGGGAAVGVGGADAEAVRGGVG